MGISMKFGHKILLGACVISVAVFLSFSLLNDHRQQASTREALHSSLQTTGKLLGANLDNWLAGRLLLIEGAAETIAADPTPATVSKMLSQDIITKTFIASYVGFQDSRFFIYPERVMPDGYDVRQRQWYKEAAASLSPVLTEPYIGAGIDYLIMTEAVPIKINGKAAGVFGASLSLEKLASIVNSVDLNGIGYAFLVSDDGKILVHPDSALVTKTLAQAFPEGAPGINDNLNEVQENGSTRIVTFTPINGLPSLHWSIGLSVDKDKAYAALHEFRTSALIATLIAVLITIVLLGLLINALMRPLRHMGLAMQSIADGEGDLTQRLQSLSQDEFGVMAGGFNRFVERIQHSIREVLTSSSQLTQLAAQVSQASHSSLKSSDTQAALTHNIATAINELGAAAQEIARSAAHASNRASDTKNQTQEGQQVVERSISAMAQLSSQVINTRQDIESLNEKTLKIGRILDVIKGISDQTNLLALNAAIEAARAGDAGRGFAVVSDEVRTLAHRTQESAQEIHHMIEELQAGAGSAVNAMLESQRHSDTNVSTARLAGERLNQVLLGIGEIDEINLSMATATEEQTSVVDNLDRDISHINDLNQKTVGNLQSTLQACNELEKQSIRLQQLVNTFKI
ncbi:methyl-accepting chemotaxis protein [Pseudomonas mediterranea]|uniref:Methyl-accepting chemotaxis protein n=1 Tax=Pseudomonas mediterranea TaxID=183795 RepID=A0AAX2D6C1_9PSED|nr:methyl-accepting chemotaxis protein [Pseudomonas mediterranea]KGU82267.1 chemotaxis protein [Pseudomonas mediterranea CFBP 5447]SDU14164.1 methyl-accepting chemotaxis protein [Pseudomonas mediterranea]